MDKEATKLHQEVRKAVWKARKSSEVLWADVDFFSGPVSGRPVIPSQVRDLCTYITCPRSFSDLHPVLAVEGDGLLFVVGGNHRLQAVSGVVPVQELPYKLVDVTGIKDHKGESITITKHAGLIVGMVEATESRPVSYTPLQDCLLLDDTISACRRYVSNTLSQLEEKKIFNVKVHIKANTVLKFYEQHVFGSILTLEKQGQRAMKLRTLRGMMKLLDIPRELFNKLISAEEQGVCSVSASQIKSIGTSSWSVSDVLSLVQESVSRYGKEWVAIPLQEQKIGEPVFKSRKQNVVSANAEKKGTSVDVSCKQAEEEGQRRTNTSTDPIQPPFKPCVVKQENDETLSRLTEKKAEESSTNSGNGTSARRTRRNSFRTRKRAVSSDHYGTSDMQSISNRNGNDDPEDKTGSMSNKKRNLVPKRTCVSRHDGSERSAKRSKYYEPENGPRGHKRKNLVRKSVRTVEGGTLKQSIPDTKEEEGKKSDGCPDEEEDCENDNGSDSSKFSFDRHIRKGKDHILETDDYVTSKLNRRLEDERGEKNSIESWGSDGSSARKDLLFNLNNADAAEDGNMKEEYTATDKNEVGTGRSLGSIGKEKEEWENLGEMKSLPSPFITINRNKHFAVSFLGLSKAWSDTVRPDPTMGVNIYSVYNLHVRKFLASVQKLKKLKEKGETQLLEAEREVIEQSMLLEIVRVLKIEVEKYETSVSDTGVLSIQEAISKIVVDEQKNRSKNPIRLTRLEFDRSSFVMNEEQMGQILSFGGVMIDDMVLEFMIHFLCTELRRLRSYVIVPTLSTELVWNKKKKELEVEGDRIWASACKLMPKFVLDSLLTSDICIFPMHTTMAAPHYELIVMVKKNEHTEKEKVDRVFYHFDSLGNSMKRENLIWKLQSFLGYVGNKIYGSFSPNWAMNFPVFEVKVPKQNGMECGFRVVWIIQCISLSGTSCFRDTLSMAYIFLPVLKHNSFEAFRELLLIRTKKLQNFCKAGLRHFSDTLLLERTEDVSSNSCTGSVEKCSPDRECVEAVMREYLFSFSTVKGPKKTLCALSKYIDLEEIGKMMLEGFDVHRATIKHVVRIWQEHGKNHFFGINWK